MKYLKLHAPIFSGGKSKKIVLEKSFAKTPFRDKITENLFQILTVSWDANNKRFVPKQFESLEDHKKLQKFKERVVFTEADTVELGNDLFDWIRANFKTEHFDANASEALVALSGMLDECEKQDEAAAEKEFKASKDKKPVTVEEYHKSLGYKVEIEEEKKD